jgi:uncharacterized protein
VLSPPLVGTPRPKFSEYYREHVWATPSGMYSRNQLKFILAEIGAERIIHSEDFPYVVRDNVSDFLEHADLTDVARHASHIARPKP